MSSNNAEDSAQDNKPASFIALADYEVPSMPARDSVNVLYTRARELLRRKPPSPMIADDRLQRSTLEMLDEVASPPACGPLLEELDASLAEWLADADSRLSTRLIVLPPGDRNGVIEAWATTHGQALLAAPDRAEVIGGTRDAIPDLAGDSLLVIPALENWFLRHQHGLNLIRDLLDALDGLDRHVLIGCNSWAWQYLKRAVRADAVLPEPLIFRAFDAPRLYDWFNDIAQSDGMGTVHFRDAESGEDIMGLDDDGKPHDLLESLAARSLGIPWVAWRLWRRSLRRRIEQENEEIEADARAQDNEPDVIAENDDAQTLWVIALEEFLLPGTDDVDTLLLIQALLIHGPLPLTLLRQVVPEPGATRLLPSLVSSGIIERRDDGRLACASAAYPAIRSGLTAAGFPIADV